MKAKLAVSVCIILLTIMLFIPYTYAADNNVGIKVEFDKDKYVTGETATATLTLTGLQDEKDANLSLGAFETHLKFNALPTKNNLEYVSDGSGFSSSLKTKLESESTATSGIIFGVAEADENKNIFVISFDSQKGITLKDTVDTSGNLVIGTMKFKVNAEKGSMISVSIESDDNIESNNYTNVVTKPFGTEDKGEEYKCNVVEGGETSAQIVGAVMENPTATFSGNTVNGSVDVRLPQSDSGVLFAVLRETSTGLIKQSKIEENVVASKTGYDVTFKGITNNSNLKIDYYLWKSLFSMKAIAENVSAEVTTGN